MPVIGNNGRAILNGLSDFWLRFFKDLGDVEAAYEGTAVLLGQTYLNMLSDVLNTSVEEVPLFKKEYYRLITVREDQVWYVDTGISGQESWRIVTDENYGEIPYLQNKIFAPTAGFDDTIDYDVVGGQIYFKQDPTAPIPDGFANRDVDIPIAGTFSSGGVVWGDIGVKKNDVLVVNKFVDVSALSSGDPANTLRFRIRHLDGEKLFLSANVSTPKDLTGYSWRIERTLTTGALRQSMPGSAAFSGAFTANTSMRVRELAMWAVDAEVDDGRLYAVYGHYFGNQRLSSEAYRAFIRGLMQLYVLGPVVDRIESALNVMAGLPVIRDDGETLLSYSDGLDDAAEDGEVDGVSFTSASANFSPSDVGGFLTVTDAENATNIGVFQILQVSDSSTVVVNRPTSFITETGLSWQYSLTDLQVVRTSRALYELPRRVPMRADVVNPDNFGTLSFRAFEALTTAAVVTDYIKDPEWWIDITLPRAILDRESPVLRTLSPQLLPNEIGPVGEYVIGDPGFYISASEDGVLTGQAEVRSSAIPLNVLRVAPTTLTTLTVVDSVAAVATCTFPPGLYSSVSQYLTVLATPSAWSGGQLPPVTFYADGLGGIIAQSQDVGPNVILQIGGTANLPFPGAPAFGFVGRHHRAAFILMDRYLKTHIMSVTLDGSLDLSGALIRDMEKVLMDVKPAHVALFFTPLTKFRDVISVSDYLERVRPKIATEPDFILPENNEFLVGSSWLIGDGWQFSDPEGGAIDIGTGDGYVFVAIGGLDPGIQPVRPAGEPVAYYIDRALYVNPRPA